MSTVAPQHPVIEITEDVRLPPEPKEPKIFLPLLDNGNGSVMSSFMMDHCAAFAKRTVLMTRAADSHANRGMNKIANMFLATDCDVWINIDADIRFRRMDIDNLLSHDLPLVYGIYPKKETETSPCLCTFATVEPDAKGLAEVRRAGRGFMLVKREVLEAMKEDNGGPALRYHNHSDDGRVTKIEWDFFTSGPVTGAFSALDNTSGDKSLCPECSKDADTSNIRCSTCNGALWIPLDKDGYPIREWISEDWYFCERARALGYKTIVDTTIALGHIGLKAYYFSGDQVIRMDSNITCWQNIHGWFDYEALYRRLAAIIPDGGRFVEVGCWLGRSIAGFYEFQRKLEKHIDIHVVDTFAGDAGGNLEFQNIITAHGGNIEKAFRANMKALKIHCIPSANQPPDWPTGPTCNIYCEDCTAAHQRFEEAQHLFIHAKPSVQGADDFENGSLDAVFIDDDHHKEFVHASIQAWLPKVKRGGIICGHDIDEIGVNAAVYDNFSLGRVEVVGRCWLVKL